MTARKRWQFRYVFALTIALVSVWPSLASIPPPDGKSFIVFFRAGSTDLLFHAETTLKQVALEIARGGFNDGPIHVDGHADTEELDVSSVRAELVKTKLIDMGIPASRMAVSARGTQKRLIVNPPGVPEVQNQRVEIRIERLCAGSCPDYPRFSGSSRDR